MAVVTPPILETASGDEFVQVVLVNTTAADTNGAWFDCGPYHSASIEVDFGAAATGNVNYYGSNDAAPGATAGVLINGAAITADKLDTIEVLPRWLRVAATTVVNTIVVRATFRCP